MATLRADSPGVNPGQGTSCAHRDGMYYMTSRLIDSLYNGRRRDFDLWRLELRKNGLAVDLVEPLYKPGGR